jgi:hypothetical protein
MAILFSLRLRAFAGYLDRGIIFVKHNYVYKDIPMKRQFSVLLCLFFMNISSCTKEDAIVIESKEGFLINKKWQLTGMSLKAANGITTNEYDSLPSYRKDDYFLFKPDSTYEFNDNTDTMPGKHSRILDVGSWKFKNRQTLLEMHSDVYNTTYNDARIMELSSGRLSLERTHPGDGTVTITTYKPL